MAWKIVAVNPHPAETYDIEHAILRPLGAEIRRVTVRTDAELIAIARDADVVMPVWREVRRVGANEIVVNVDAVANNIRRRSSLSINRSSLRRIRRGAGPESFW
jgi:outer membrane lipopolysaccharide assembly protein LptE/RlpB